MSSRVPHIRKERECVGHPATWHHRTSEHRQRVKYRGYTHNPRNRVGRLQNGIVSAIACSQKLGIWRAAGRPREAVICRGARIIECSDHFSRIVNTIGYRCFVGEA